VDLYDDVIANSSGNRGDDDGNDAPSTSPSSTPTTNNVSKANSISDRDGRDGITPLRKHQAYVGGLTWVSWS
jgi:hypothetical protein